MKFKENHGVTLIALTVTIIIILFITGMILYNSRNGVSLKKIDNLRIDIDTISSRVDEYYLNYGELPILCEYLTKQQLTDSLQMKASAKDASLGNDLNVSDGENYYVIDLEKLDGLTLNYGYDTEYKKIKENKQITYTYLDDGTYTVEDEIYIINEVTHEIYFPYGISVDGYMYIK